MGRALELIDEIRSELAPVTEKLQSHRYLSDLESGHLPKHKLGLFAAEQHAIISSDLRSVALLVHRFGANPSRDFFLNALEGERSALAALGLFARGLGMDGDELSCREPLPGCHAYAAYMAWLASQASDAEVAAAYLVNFQAWGQNCGRMSSALRRHYSLEASQVAFFDQFALAPGSSFEAAALAVVEEGLDRGVDPRLIRRSARLLQAYELLYWDSLAEARTDS